MRALWGRLLGAAGGIALVVSIFLPPTGRGRLYSEIHGAADALVLTVEAPDASATELMYAVAPLVMMLYVPLCGILTVLAALLPGAWGRSKVGVGIALGLQSLFLGVMLLIGALSWRAGEVYPDPRLYPVLTLGSCLLLGAVWTLGLWVRHGGRVAATCMPPLLVMALAFGGITFYVLRHYSRDWGALGLEVAGAGALVGLIGCLLRMRPRP